ARILAVVVALFALAACSGGSKSSGASFCDQYQSFNDLGSDLSTSSDTKDDFAAVVALYDAHADELKKLVDSAPSEIKADLQDVIGNLQQAIGIIHKYGDDVTRAVSEGTDDEKAVLNKLGAAASGSDSAGQRIDDYLRSSCPNVHVPEESKFSTVGSAV